MLVIGVAHEDPVRTGHTVTRCCEVQVQRVCAGFHDFAVRHPLALPATHDRGHSCIQQRYSQLSSPLSSHALLRQPAELSGVITVRKMNLKQCMWMALNKEEEDLPFASE